MIPKVIHYCWFGGQPYSPLIEQCMSSWKEKLPEYQIKRWDESNSPIEHCRFARQAFEAKKWAFVADYVRLHVLYNEGGIYLDTDMFVLKSFNPLLHHNCFLGLEEPGKANCAIVGTVRHHVFIHEMLKYYESFAFEPKKLIAIPVRLSDVLIPKGMKPENTLQEICDVHIYPTDYFYPWSFRDHYRKKDFMSSVTPDSYAVHLWEGSWFSATKYLKEGRYEEGFPKVWKEMRENPFQSLRFYKRVIIHGVKYVFQKTCRFFRKGY